MPGTTIGTLGVPVISYNLTQFWEFLKASQRSMIITGLCPISTIANELGLVLADGKVVKPTIGFKTLNVDHKDAIEVAWPNKPIVSDYLAIKNVLELYQSCQDQCDPVEISVIIWYPNYEYYLDLTENIFKSYLDAGILRPEQIQDGLDHLTKRYYKLVEHVKAELGLDAIEPESAIRLLEVDKDQYNALEKIRVKVDLSFFKKIYGSWVGNSIRRNLFEQLIIKHIRPVFDGINTLHLDTSYELWVDLLGSCIVEQNGLLGNFSWVAYPSLPAVSLSHMREYNAPFDDKLYLGKTNQQFQDQIRKLPKKYMLNIAPLILGKEKIMHRASEEIIRDLETKLIVLNECFNS